MDSKHLMVFTLDRFSNLIAKGEVLPRYYNPSNIFERVTIVTCNWRKDDIDESLLLPMVGDAELEIIQYVLPSPLATIGWRFIDRWLIQGVEMLAPKSPDLIWSLNCFQHGQLAARLSKKNRVPLVVSLHGRWDVDERQNLIRWLYSTLRIAAEQETLRSADMVMPVYGDIIPYAKKRGATRIELVYNTINASSITTKVDYRLKNPPRILSINRQVSQKDPSNIIRAIHEYNIECQLDLIGNGPLHSRLESLVDELGLRGKVNFIPALPNEEVCQILHQYDVSVSTCHYHGISKGTLEAAYAGLPIIINQRIPEPISELQDGWAYVTSDSISGYGQALIEVLSDGTRRRQLGELAFHAVRTKYRPQDGELIRSQIFETLMQSM